MSECKKCKAVPGTIILRVKDFYCSDCFIANINHKFRACIGKSRILTQNDKVLICLSGGHGSTVLLNLLHDSLTVDTYKKLLIKPIIFHLIDFGTEDNVKLAKLLINQCNIHNYDIYLSHISEYLATVRSKPKQNDIPDRNNEAHTQLKKILNDMSSSSQNDYLIKIKRELFVWYAKELQCDAIFTADTSSTLAVNLISNLSLGRGTQVQHDIGFCDSRNEVKILRPLKDITNEELQHYLSSNRLTPLKVQAVQENSLQSIIELFINDLQQNFQSTISTICKTAEKIGIQNENKHTTKCLLCESGLSENECKLTALEATNYSRTVSTGQQKNTCGKKDFIDQNASMFPHVNKYLCFACSKLYLEMKPTTIPLQLKSLT